MSLDRHTEKLLRRNIRLFSLYRIFVKRTFLPLTVIYAVEAGGLSIQQVGICAAASSLASVLLDAATGYWADIHGRKKATLIGATLALISTMIYVVAPSFLGILAASILLGAGFSFMSGAMAALIHDSLVALDDEKNFAKIASRSQAHSLIANAVLVTLVPLTYTTDKRLPFVIGCAGFVMLIVVAAYIYEPPRPASEDVLRIGLTKAVRTILNRRTALFFISLGIMTGITTGTSDMQYLSIRELGFEPSRIGLLVGISSLIGAAIGYFIHHLRKLSFSAYICFDIATSLLLYIAAGLLRSLPLTIAAFILNLSLWRYQNILYQHYLLLHHKDPAYKATLLSLLANFKSLSEVWIALVITGIADRTSILTGMVFVGLLFVLIWPLVLLGVRQLQDYSGHTPVASTTN